MAILPEQIPLHLTKIDAASGQWLIAVASVGETEGGSDLLLKLILEQKLDEEHFHSRELGLIASAAEVFDAEISAEVVERIRNWIETTEGDGLLDLVRRS